MGISKRTAKPQRGNPRVVVRVSPVVLQRVVAFARGQGVTKSAVVNRALRDFLDKEATT